MTSRRDGAGPLAEVWSIAWPTVLTMTSYTVMQFVDKLMVGQVGPLEVAAQGNAGIWAFVAIAVAMGFLTVVNTFVSQNLGAGTPRNGPRYAWAACWISLAFYVVVLLPYALVLPWLFGHMHDPEEVTQYDRLVRLEVTYGRILLLGAVIMLCGRGVHHFFFGMHRPKIVTLSAAVGNSTNVVANYVFIFGEQGLPAIGLPGVPGVPAMGLAGAALGTVLGTVVELAIPAAIFLGPRMNRELGTRAAWRPSPEAIRGLLRIGWPGALQFGNEIVCWSIFMTVLVGRFGENHMTAAWVALGYMHLSFMPAVGLSVAVTSLVGKYIGAGSHDTAYARTRLGLAMALVYMSVCALIFLLFGGPLVSIFVGGESVGAEQAREIVRIGSALMICAAVFQTVDALGIVYTGALRGAGDTVWPGMVTVLYSWLFIVGGGWAMTELWPQLESIGPWVGASVYIFAFGITMAVRFESGRWRSITLVEGEHAESCLVAPVPPTSNPDAAIRDIAVEIGEAVSEAEAGE